MFRHRFCRAGWTPIWRRGRRSLVGKRGRCSFDFHDIAITAGKDVAFATAIGRCCDLSSGEKVQLEFRLTMRFRKHDGRWRIMHEHHSIPAIA